MRDSTPNYVFDIAKRLRKNQTDAETIFWESVKGRNLDGLKFRRQYPIGRYIADFYCAEHKLVIEIDGKFHDEVEAKEYDRIRSKEIESRNIKVLRFKNEDIIGDFDKIKDIILKEITPLPISGEGQGVRG